MFKKKNKKSLKVKIIMFIISLIVYTAVFLLVNAMFDSFVIDYNHIYIYSIVAVILISILNKTVKPILVKLTIPLTAITLGLFYFVINMFILKIVEWVMLGKIKFESLPILFFISIVFSILNFIANDVILKPVERKINKMS
jgi:putative membrane protein